MQGTCTSSNPCRGGGDGAVGLKRTQRVRPADRLRTKSRQPQRGAVLALVMGILVIVAVVGAGLLSTSGASRIEAVRRHQSLQCFWLAKSGLAQAGEVVERG